MMSPNVRQPLALHARRDRGFTLIELVMVIVILGVVASMVAVFMKAPIDAYFVSGRRAALTDIADTTVRRMARDFRSALPNSVRPITNQCVDFIPTKTGGRYRASGSGALNFAATNLTFNMLGNNDALPADQKIGDQDQIVVYNLGIAGADAYLRQNVATVSGAPTYSAVNGETTINLNPAFQFPLESGSKRFQVVPANEHVVTYVCVGAGIVAGQGTGTLFRFGRQLAGAYALPGTCPAVPAGTPSLATNVSNCVFTYGGSDLQRNALLSMSIQLTLSNETVSLQHQVNVSNTP